MTMMIHVDDDDDDEDDDDDDEDDDDEERRYPERTGSVSVGCPDGLLRSGGTQRGPAR